jgi:CBS domain-containing protein/GNAT superfamily N-acetyltransferase
MKIDLTETTIHNFPHAFINRKGEPILITTLSEKRHALLVEMYLAFRPRNCFCGLPPLSDEACVRWVHGMIATGINLIALAFDGHVAGHCALFPINDRACETLLVVTPALQRIGIGTELVHCSIQLANELDFERLQLNVEAKNHVARHVYEKCGFRYESHGLLDEVDMGLDLHQYRSAMNVPVREIMNKDVRTVRPTTPCSEALNVFLHDGFASLPVLSDGNEVAGILSKTDLLVEANIDRRVSEVLTRDVVTVHEGCPLAEVISLFRSRKLRCLPVVNHHRRLVGIVSRREVLAYYMRCHRPGGPQDVLCKEPPE